MNNIKFGNNVMTWNIVSALALLALVVTVVYDYVTPIPSAIEAKKKEIQKQTELRRDLRQDEERYTKIDSEIANLITANDGENLAPQTLKEVNTLAAMTKVKVKSFRPQRPETGSDVTRMNFVVLCEGDFPNVMAFLRAADEPGVPFGVYLIQMASSDGESDKVNLTIGIVAYASPEIERAPQQVKSETGEQKSSG